MSSFGVHSFVSFHSLQYSILRGKKLQAKIEKEPKTLNIVSFPHDSITLDL